MMAYQQAYHNLLLSQNFFIQHFEIYIVYGITHTIISFYRQDIKMMTFQQHLTLNTIIKKNIQ